MQRIFFQTALTLLLLAIASCTASDQPLLFSTLPPSATTIPPSDTPQIPITTSIPSTNTPFPTSDTLVPSITPTTSPTETTLPTVTATLLPPLSGSGGGIIAFTSDRDNNSEIYIMNADGSDPQRLTDHPFSDTSPMWSPDGTQIVFVSARDGNRNIYIMNRDGSNLYPLIEHSSDDLNPMWSPDGSKIGFVSLRDGNAEIYQVNTNGSGLQRLTQNTYDDWEFEWSPKGTQMAISSQKTGFANIFLISADGSGELKRITETEGHDVYPRWSPDGSQIAFTSNRDGNWEIYLMNSDGSNQRRLTTSEFNEGPPFWSPDGNQLIFESDQNSSKSIYIMNIDGSGYQLVTDDESNNWEPSWKSTSQNQHTQESAQSILIPSGSLPIIDGSISPNEWIDATKKQFLDDSELLLLHSGGYLYLGIRSATPDMIVGNVFVNRGDKVSILHTSAALGTAIYQQSKNDFQQIKNFQWCCRSTSDSASAQVERDEFFREEGWISVNSRVGNPNELEYQIKLGDEPIQLAVNFLEATSNSQYEKIPWPANLTDDVILPTPGGLPLQFVFSLEDWISLNFQSQK